MSTLNSACHDGTAFARRLRWRGRCACHRPSPARRRAGAIRTIARRTHRGRRARHRARDLPRARSGQLREHDDVDSGRAHPGAQRGGDRWRLQQAARQDGCFPLRLPSFSRTACRARTCTSGASRSVPVAGVRPGTTPRWVRRCSRLCSSGWWVAWGCSRRSSDASGDGGHARRPVVGSRTSTRSRSPTTGTTRPEPWCSPGWRRGRPLPSSPPTRKRCARALLDRLLAQDDEPKVPVLELIDSRLLRREGDGYRYHDMPDDGDAWKRSVSALDDDADRRCHERLRGARHAAPEAPHRAGPDCAGHLARDARAPRVRTLDALRVRPRSTRTRGRGTRSAFRGPAYPRGYKALGLDRLEPFERREHDPHDPIPWLRKVEAARAEHDERPDPSRSGADTTAETD